MNIILVPSGNRHGRSASFSQKHIVILFLAAVAVPALFGVLAFQAANLLHGGGRRDAVARLAAQRVELRRQQVTIEQAREHTQTHLNALAQRMGQLQAEILRLNALGDRVAHIAGVDSHEFDFRYTRFPPSADDSVDNDLNGDFLSTLDDLDHRVGHQRKELSSLETALAHGRGGSVREIQERLLADDLDEAGHAVKPVKSPARVARHHQRKHTQTSRQPTGLRKDKLVSYTGPRTRLQTGTAAGHTIHHDAGQEASPSIGLAEAAHGKKATAVQAGGSSPSTPRANIPQTAHGAEPES